jgi:hypothetical protein
LKDDKELAEIKRLLGELGRTCIYILGRVVFMLLIIRGLEYLCGLDVYTGPFKGISPYIIILVGLAGFWILLEIVLHKPNFFGIDDTEILEKIKTHPKRYAFQQTFGIAIIDAILEFIRLRF